MKTLGEYLAQYTLSHDLEPGSEYQLRRTMSVFTAFQEGRPTLLAALSDDLLNRFIVWLKLRYAARTVYTHRGNLLTLWRAAFDDGLVATLPRRVRPVTVPPPLPHALTPEDMARVLALCETFGGRWRLSRIPKGRLLKAVYLTGYETGLRPIDLWLLKRSDIGDDGWFTILQHKTSRPVTRCVRPATLELIDSLFPPEREYIFRGAASREYVSKATRWIGRQLGIRFCLKHLRSTCGTWCDIEHPGQGAAALGHAKMETFTKHYRDTTRYPRRLILPPEVPPWSAA